LRVCNVFIRSHDGRLLVVSSTDGYCTLISFDENELGTEYKKTDVVTPVIPPVEAPVYQAVEVSSKDQNVVETPSVTDCSPQRKKARRVVLQTLSTNVEDFPNEMIGGKTDTKKNSVGGEAVSDGEKCRRDVGRSTPLCGDVIGGREPEQMEVCGDDVHITPVCDKERSFLFVS